MARRELVLEGPIGRAMMILAWPVIAAEAIHTAFHLVDVYWVRWLGPWATSAIMTSMFTLWMAFALANLVTTGLVAHVSRAVGAGDRTRAGHAVAQSVYLCLMLGAIVMVAGWFGAPRLYALLGTDAQVSSAGTAYLRVLTLGSPLAFLYLTAGAVLRATGNTLLPMKVTGVALLLNAGLAPLLIYGPGPFPELGVAGSAIATVLGMGGAVAAYVWIALGRHPDLPLDRESLRRLDPAMLGALARVGAPYAAVSMLFSLVYLWYAHLAAVGGAAAVAVIGIGNRLESITYLTADGFAAATATFVGQNLGARNPRRAERGAWRAVGMMALFGVAITALLLAAPRALMAVFTDDATTIELGVSYLRVLALCQLATAVEGVLGGGFAGAGDTVPPMAVHVTFAVARLPLAAWAVRDLGLGVMGIAWTMSLSCIVRSLVLAWWFRRGRWKDRVLPAAAPAPAA